MLKKLLFIFALVIATGNIVRSQDLIVTPSDTTSLDTTTTCLSESILIHSIMNNTASDTLLMNWRIVYNTFPHPWTLGFCDPINCYTLTQVGSHVIHFTLYPGATKLMQLDLTPTSGTGSGYFQVFLWASNDSVNTATYLNYKSTINATCFGVGITDIDASQISFYPNPAHGQLKLIMPQALTNGQLDIFNLLGSKVYSQVIGKEATKDIDLSAFETGLYVARVSDGGKIIATKKFTKAE